MQEKAAIINSLRSMFFATYYVNLEKDLFRAVMQKEEVGNILGDERSYSQGIQMYARNFVHPDDRESFLENMNYENLLRTLSRPIMPMQQRAILCQG